MTDTTLHPMTELAPLVAEDDIINMVESKSTAHPGAKSYGSFPAEWIEDVEAIDLVMEVRDKYEAALVTLRQENVRLAEEIEQLQHGQRNP